jgi:putative ABC transport system permease protein
MEYPLVLKALRRHKLTVGILLLQFAVTFALLSNASVLIWQRFEALRTPSGVVEKGLLVAKAVSKNMIGLTEHSVQVDVMRAALAAIRGVHSVSVLSQTPFSGDGNQSTGWIAGGADPGAPAQQIGAYYFGYSALQTLQFRLVAGRWFTRDEIAHPAGMPNPEQMHLVVLTRQLAQQLFPNEQPLGKTAYNKSQSMTIIGIVEHLARPDFESGSSDGVVIFPVEPWPTFQNEVAFRLDAGADEKSIESQARAIFDRVATPNVSWSLRTFAEQRADLFSTDRAALRILLFILVALIVVAINAVAGLSYYWVNQRSHHVATRRALGAMRRQVIAYFLFENVCLCLAGALLGLVLTLSVNTWLMLHFGAPRIPLVPLIVGFLVAAVIGQLAVAYPAWKIGRISPALASRI